MAGRKVIDLISTQGWSFNDFGQKSRPALVLLHGFLGDGLDWERLAQALSAEFYCLCPDLPGHGASLAALPPGRLSLSGLAAGLHSGLAELGARTIRLAGYSLGGRLALTYAVRYPKQVRALVLESCSPGLQGRQARAERRVQDARWAQVLHERGMERFLAEWYAQPLFASLRARPDIFADLLQRRKRCSPAAMARVIGELSPGRQPSLWGRLERVQAPVLLLGGGLDEKYSAILRAMAERLPSARLAFAPDAGHNLHLEAADWQQRQIADFLTRYPA